MPYLVLLVLSSIREVRAAKVSIGCGDWRRFVNAVSPEAREGAHMTAVILLALQNVSAAGV
jgi:hypothetical protein